MILRKLEKEKNDCVQPRFCLYGHYHFISLDLDYLKLRLKRRRFTAVKKYLLTKLYVRGT